MFKRLRQEGDKEKNSFWPLLSKWQWWLERRACDRKVAGSIPKTGTINPQLWWKWNYKNSWYSVLLRNVSFCSEVSLSLQGVEQVIEKVTFFDLQRTCVFSHVLDVNTLGSKSNSRDTKQRTRYPERLISLLHTGIKMYRGLYMADYMNIMYCVFMSV